MTALTVNDRPVDFDMDPETPLLFALREHLARGTLDSNVLGLDRRLAPPDHDVTTGGDGVGTLVVGDRLGVDRDVLRFDARAIE